MLLHHFLLGRRQADVDLRAARRGFVEHNLQTIRSVSSLRYICYAHAVSSNRAYPGWRTWQPVETDRPPIFWVEHELPEEPWTAAYGFVARDDDLALAEVRIFPTRNIAQDRGGDPRQRKREIAEWSRKANLVPIPGIPARVLRMLRPGAAQSVALDHVLRTDTAAGHAGDFSVRADRGAPRATKPRRDPRLLARVALLYEDATTQETERFAPNDYIYNNLLGTEYQLARRSIEKVVSDARKAGYLTPAVRGRPGGRATPAAHELLAGEETEVT